MMHDHIGGIRDPLKQDLALEICRIQNKVINMLTLIWVGFLGVCFEGVEK